MPLGTQIPTDSTRAPESLMRLITAGPFVGYVRNRKIDPTSALQNMGLNAQDLSDPNRFVHAEIVYGLLNNLAHLANEPFLGVLVGEMYDLTTWLTWVDDPQGPGRLVDTLTRIVTTTSRLSSAVTHRLEVTADRSVYRVHRNTPTGNSPAHADGFGAATFLRILERIEDDHWNPTEITFETAYPDALPPGYRGITIKKVEPGTMSLIFPTGWLLSTLPDTPSAAGPAPSVKDRPSLIAAIEGVASDLLERGEKDLLESVAARLGLATSDFKAALRKLDTSFSVELRAVRIRLAKRALTDTDQPISDIGRRLGFSDAANFTRFFRSHAGRTPSDFRKTRTTASPETNGSPA